MRRNERIKIVLMVGGLAWAFAYQAAQADEICRGEVRLPKPDDEHIYLGMCLFKNNQSMIDQILRECKVGDECVVNGSGRWVFADDYYLVEHISSITPVKIKSILHEWSGGEGTVTSDPITMTTPGELQYTWQGIFTMDVTGVDGKLERHQGIGSIGKPAHRRDWFPAGTHIFKFETTGNWSAKLVLTDP